MTDFEIPVAVSSLVFTMREFEPEAALALKPEDMDSAPVAVEAENPTPDSP